MTGRTVKDANTNTVMERGGHDQLHMRDEMVRPYEGAGLSKTLMLSWLWGGGNMP